MKRTSLLFSLLVLTMLVLMTGRDAYGQSDHGVVMGKVNVREIVSIRTQRSLDDQIDGSQSMPEHETPRSHSPASIGVHLSKDHKEMEANQGTGQASPAPLIGFDSKSFDGYYPPDAHGAVSENYVVGTVNDELYIQDRSGNLIADVRLKDFWVPVHQTTRLFDPRILYDVYTHRWILVTAANAASDSSSLLIGVSQSEDPTAVWNLYKIKADSSGNLWADFPNIAFNKNWVVVTVNLFGDTSDNSDTGRVYIFNKNELMNGLTPSLKTFNIDQGVSPAVTYDSSMNDLYLMETYSEPASQLQMLKIWGDVGSEKISSMGYPAIHTPWNPIPPDYKDFAPQLGDTGKIQCNDDRMGNVLVKNNVIWCTHTVFLPAGAKPNRSSVLWWALDTNGEVLQHGLIDDPTGNNFYAFPSIAVNKYDDALIGYSVFNAQQYPSAGYSYHDHAQFPGSVNSPYVFKNGENSYYRSGGGRNRWGDYSATVIDPVNDIDFWTINEYAQSTANSWGTWWVQVSGLDTINHNTDLTFGLVLAPNPNNGIFNLYFSGQVNTPVQIDIYDLLGQHMHSQTSTSELSSIAINTALFADGIYVVRVKVNGQTIDRKMVLRY